MKRLTFGVLAAVFIFALASSGRAVEPAAKEAAATHMMKAKCPHEAMMEKMPMHKCAAVCRTPVIVMLKEGKIVVEPDPVWVYWGNAIDFQVIADEGEKVTLVFDRDPFKERLSPAEYSITGTGKITTDKSYRPEPLERGKTLAEKMKLAQKFKYSVKWSGGRAGRGLVLDPEAIFVDNGW